MKWYANATIGFTLNNEQSITSGTEHPLDECHTFDEAKKITKIETIIDNIEWSICQIHFYHNEERLRRVGLSDDKVKSLGSKIRTEVFKIADDEQLIGCRLENS